MTKVKCDQEHDCKFNRGGYCSKDEIVIGALDCGSYEELNCTHCEKFNNCQNVDLKDMVCEDFEYKHVQEESNDGKVLFEKLEEIDIFAGPKEEK